MGLLPVPVLMLVFGIMVLVFGIMVLMNDFAMNYLFAGPVCRMVNAPPEGKA